MKLYRLIYRDVEYGYDIYEGLFKTKESLINEVLKKLKEDHSSNILGDGNSCDIIQDKDNKSHYYINYIVSNFPTSSEKYGSEDFTIYDYEYEIIDTDTLV